MTTLQYLSFIFTIFDLILCIILIKFYKNLRIYLINASIYLGHILLFYFALIEETIENVARPYPEFFTQWSAIIRLHELITTMFILLYFVKWNVVLDKLNKFKKRIGERLWTSKN